MYVTYWTVSGSKVGFKPPGTDVIVADATFHLLLVLEGGFARVLAEFPAAADF